ncbi:MAG: hypothetical protein LBB09_02235 [Rickettsiales bacterium]|nr:hypothetical protein [Rickettsiales bacterium]
MGRLIVCQALYMFFDQNNEDKEMENILDAIGKYYIGYIYMVDDFTIKNGTNDYKKLHRSKFVVGLANYALQNAPQFDLRIKKYLTRDNPLETIDPMLTQIMRVAIGERELYPNLSKSIIIDEYANIAGNFFNDAYVSFVNGILPNIFSNGEPPVRDKKESVDKGTNGGRKILSLKK